LSIFDIACLVGFDVSAPSLPFFRRNVVSPSDIELRAVMMPLLLMLTGRTAAGHPPAGGRKNISNEAPYAKLNLLKNM